MHRDAAKILLPSIFAVLLTYVARINDMVRYPDNPVDPADIRRFFRVQDKTVLTFIGYSGTGYEDPEGMLKIAKGVLAEFDPARTIVNCGATRVGIGAVYELAKRMGFQTTGIVSIQAKESTVELSPHVDRVFLVQDETWGGLREGSQQLSPTSAAMVEISDVLVGIGGGAIGRDEMTAARRLGKPVRFYPADMNHRRAIEQANNNGLPAPTDFRGEAGEVF